MTAGPATGFVSDAALTVKKGASTASCTFTRYLDGSFAFTTAAGTKRFPHSDALKKLFDAINALV